MSLATFELKLMLRSGWLITAAALFAVLAGGVTAVALSTFKVLGLGAASPAAIALLDLGLLFPSAFALVAGGTALGADREGGFLAMMRAAGVGAGEIAVAKIIAAAGASWLVLTAGYGASALVLAGNVPAAELPRFVSVISAALIATLASAAIGVAIAAATRERHEALLAAMVVWFTFAIGLELVVLALAPLIRGGAPAVLLLLVADPLESARALGLLALGLDGELLGSFGTFLVTTQGRLGATLALLAVVLAWIAGATLAAERLIDTREA